MEGNGTVANEKMNGVAVITDEEAEEPLLRRNDGSNRGSGAHTWSGIMATTFNVSNSIIGAGVVAFPFQVVKLGIVLTTVVNVGAIVLTGLSAAGTIRGSDRTNKRSYTEAVYDEMGKWWGLVIQLCILIANTGILMIYVIMIADALVGKDEFEGVILQLTGLPYKSHWYVSRWFVSLVATLLFLLPLVSFKDVSSLDYFSASGVLVAVLFAVLGVVLAAIAIIEGKVANLEWGVPKTKSWDLTIAICGAIATFNFGFLANPALPPLMQGLQGYSLNRMLVSTNLGFLLTWLIYEVAAITLYIPFQSDTQGDILLNLTPDSLEPLIGKAAGKAVGITVLVAYALKIVLIFPLINWSLRQNVSGLIFRTHYPTGWRFYVVTYAILAIVYIISTFLTHVETAVDFVGSTAGAGIVFFIPAAVIAARESPYRGVKAKVEASLLVLVGLLTFLGTVIQLST